MGGSRKDVCVLNLKRAINLIEKKRTDINKLYEGSELTDYDVLKKSRELDELLNKYDKMLMKQE